MPFHSHKKDFKFETILQSVPTGAVWNPRFSMLLVTGRGRDSRVTSYVCHVSELEELFGGRMGMEEIIYFNIS